MKASLFELLLSLFEKTLTQLKEKQQVVDASSARDLRSSETLVTESKVGVEIQVVNQPSATAMRIFSDDEQLKLTKASYQFLVRIGALGVIPVQTME